MHDYGLVSIMFDRIRARRVQNNLLSGKPAVLWHGTTRGAAESMMHGGPEGKGQIRGSSKTGWGQDRDVAFYGTVYRDAARSLTKRQKGGAAPGSPEEPVLMRFRVDPGTHTARDPGGGPISSAQFGGTEGAPTTLISGDAHQVKTGIDRVTPLSVEPAGTGRVLGRMKRQDRTSTAAPEAIPYRPL